MHLDPLITLAVALGFSILFFTSGWHKARAFAQFKLILADYQLLPEVLVTPASIVIVVGELILAALWISVALTPTYAAQCSLASAVLLAAYAFAVAINLARGRVHISCGCGVPGASDSDQPLSTGILFRNGALVLFALIPVIPERGPIVLQHHGGPDKDGRLRPASSLVQFRNIWIKSLDP